MRKLLLGIPVFIIAFVLGYATAHFYLPRLFEEQPTDNSSLSALIPEPSTLALVDATSAAASTPDQLETIDEVNSWVEGNTKYSIKLLETGDGFHGVEVPAKNGETWLGLFEEHGRYSVRRTPIEVSRVFDGIADSNLNHPTGKSVDVPGPTKPIFLVKNAPVIKEGSVKAVYRGFDDTIIRSLSERGIDVNGLEPDNLLSKEFGKMFELGGETYVLRVGEAENKNGEKIWALYLYGGNLRQVLHTVNQEYWPDIGTIYWIGDLDHDGRPDIFCELYEHDNVRNKVLFLSSKAEKGKLVKKVAHFWTTGC